MEKDVEYRKRDGSRLQTFIEKCGLAKVMFSFARLENQALFHFAYYNNFFNIDAQLQIEDGILQKEEEAQVSGKVQKLDNFTEDVLKIQLQGHFLMQYIDDESGRQRSRLQRSDDFDPFENSGYPKLVFVI